MRVILFEMPSGPCALKLEAVGRVLAPAEPIPPGHAHVDLAGLLGEIGRPGGHHLLLSGLGVALQVGRPAGTAQVDPSWILPLPGYMFRVRETPFRGIIQFPEQGLAGALAPLAGSRALLLDEEKLTGQSGYRQEATRS